MCAWRKAPAMSRARTASGQIARLGARAMSCAAMPPTIGVATLVPLADRPFAVRTETAGAERLGLLKSPCAFQVVPAGST